MPCEAPEFVNATQAQLDELLALAKAASFPQPQYDLLTGVLGTFVHVMCALQNAKTSLKRFRQMLFGKGTESTANVLKRIGSGADDADGQAGSAADDPAARPAGVGNEPRKRKGHGRNGAAACATTPSGRPCPLVCRR